MPPVYVPCAELGGVWAKRSLAVRRAHTRPARGGPPVVVYERPPGATACSHGRKPVVGRPKWDEPPPGGDRSWTASRRSIAPCGGSGVASPRFHGPPPVATCGRPLRGLGDRAVSPPGQRASGLRSGPARSDSVGGSYSCSALRRSCLALRRPRQRPRPRARQRPRQGQSKSKRKSKSKREGHGAPPPARVWVRCRVWVIIESRDSAKLITERPIRYGANRRCAIRGDGEDGASLPARRGTDHRQ